MNVERADHTVVRVHDEQRVDLVRFHELRGFDGELSLTGDHGWLIRNDLGWSIGSGQELYLGADVGHVGGPPTEWELGQTLAGAVQAFQAARPDAVLLDLQLPDADGVESAARMLRLARDVPVLIVSQNSEAAYASRLLQLGAHGYVQKDRAAHELATALRRVLAGGRYVSPELAEQLAGQIGGRSSATSLPHEALTAQEG